MEPNFDLFGLPVDEHHGGRGRPRHKPTPENKNLIMLLLALRWDDGRIANALNVSKPTLKTHYFSELQARDEARDRVEAVRLNMLWCLMRDGNVAAMKEYNRLCEKAEVAHLAAEFDDMQKDARELPLGKKAAAAREAETAGEGTGWGSDLTAPPGSRVN